MATYESILDAIGRTPLVRLRKVTRGLQATVLAKVCAQRSSAFSPAGR